MTIAEIVARLKELDTTHPPTRLQAQFLEKQVGGGSGAWQCTVQGGREFIVKCQNNRHEREDAQHNPLLPLKLLPTELVVGRLGRLFAPPVCPFTCIVDIPVHAVEGKMYSQAPSVHLMPGPSVGSEYLTGNLTSSSGATFPQVPPEQGARIVVFRTWLNPMDDQEVVSADLGIALSIDHGWYLTGSQWDPPRLARPDEFAPPTLTPDARAHISNPDVYRDALAELAKFSDDVIVEQFAGIPPEWGASHEFMAELAAFVLQRQGGVEREVAKLWKAAA